MARYFETTRECLERHGGTVEKFIGDAVMAVFGVPVLHEDDAVRCVRAAAELRDEVAALNAELERDFGVSLQVRIGVNTGEVVTGTEERLATGDAVTLAARLEQAAQPGEALLGEQTLRLVRDAVDAEAVEPLALKGKEQPVTAFRLLGVRAGEAGVQRRLDAPLVGRGAELTELRQGFDRAVRERRAVLVTLLGQAGIGKSRLAQELLDQVAADATVLRSSCLPYGEGITYWPLAAMLRETIRDDVRARAAALLEGEPDAERIADRLASSVGSGGVAAEEIAWAARKLFEHLARARPLVVVVDDLHWAEPTFLDLVDHVADVSRDAPILLLCVARPELLELRPGWSGGKLNAATLLLEPLSDGESKELIERLLAGSELPADVSTRIADASEGNPLFVEQMLALVAEDGARADVVVPPTIQALLAARLDRLGREERAVVERASVEGKVFHQGAVAELVPSSLRTEVPARLVALMRKELIRPDRSAFVGDEAFRFRHLLIRDAAYDGLSKQERAELHERFAAWVEHAAGDRAGEYDEILGYHLEQAYRYWVELGPAPTGAAALARRAASKLAASGRAALARKDAGAASSLLTRAAALLPLDDPDRLGMLPELAEALFDGGELARAEALADEAVELAEATGDARLAARARLQRLAIASLTRPDFDIGKALAEAQGIADELESHGDYELLAGALALVGRFRFFLGEAAEADRIFDRTREMSARASEHGFVGVDPTQGFRLGAKLYGPTPVSDCIAACEEVLALSPDASNEPNAHALLAYLAAMRGQFDEARTHITLAKRAAEEYGQRVERGAQVLVWCHVDLYAGDLAAAERELREGYDLLTEIGELGFRSTVASMLADVLVRRGRSSEAERLLEEVAATAASDDVDPQARWRTVKARILTERGEQAEAERLAREAVALVEPTDYLLLRAEVFSALADVLARGGRRDEAVVAQERAVAELERKGDIVGAGRARERLAELRTSRT
jgi:tetratricopeptide (TPR) repeat protein